MRFGDELIERVKDASDIVEVISEHVQLKRAGRAWKGLCPFHQEKTPSFTVNPERRIFKCFGCQAGGDVIHFIQEFEKLSFPEAMEVLARRAGIPLPKRGGPGATEESVYPALEWAAQFYRQALAAPGGVRAREYLAGRGLGEETVAAFGLGWAPPGWSNLLDARRFSPALLERAGLVIANDRGGHYDRFRGRVVVPIRSALGRTIGFGARILGPGDGPKYLNSPETDVFHKGKVLFGLSEAREALKEGNEALIVEGYMDALALAQAGFRNVVASCGTAFTRDQARVIHRYVERVVLLMDGDQAGLRAAWESAGAFLGEGLAVRVVAFPDGEDPDSFVQTRGRDAMEETIAAAPGVVGFARDVLLDRLKTREDLLKSLAYLAARIDDGIRRRTLIQEAAERFRFDEATLAREAARLRGTSPDRPAPRRETAGSRDFLGRAFLACLLSGEGVGGDVPIPEEAFREAPLRDLYRRWRELHDAGTPRPADVLMEDAGTRSQVAELLAEHEGAGWEDLLPRMRERVRAARGKEIREAIRDAESRGDREQIDRLLKELQSLKLGS